MRMCSLSPMIRYLCQRETSTFSYAGLAKLQIAFHFLVGRVHHATAPVQIALFAALVDSSFNCLPRSLRPGLSDLPTPARLSLHRQDDDGREDEHSAGGDLQRRPDKLLRHSDSVDPKLGCSAQRRNARSFF